MSWWRGREVAISSGSTTIGLLPLVPVMPMSIWPIRAACPRTIARPTRQTGYIRLAAGNVPGGNLTLAVDSDRVSIPATRALVSVLKDTVLVLFMFFCSVAGGGLCRCYLCVSGLQVRHPYRAASLPGEVSEQWFSRERPKQILCLYVRLVPLKNQNPPGASTRQHSENQQRCRPSMSLCSKPVFLVNHAFH